MKTYLTLFFVLEIFFFVISLLNIFFFKKIRKALLLFSPLIVTSIFGVILAVLTIRYQMSGTLRIFLLLAGFAPVGMFISIILHNFISGAIMKVTGKDFEEPVFFLLGIFGFPTAFAVGTVGTIVLIIKNALAK